MTMRKLADPILNDLMLMIQARKSIELTSQAVSRYVRHLDRIDLELTAARDVSGTVPQRFKDEMASITKADLAGLRKAVADGATQWADALAAREAEVAVGLLAAAELHTFAATLLEEFGAHLPDGATSASDAALRLIRQLFAERLATATPADPAEVEAPPTPPSGKAGKAAAKGAQTSAKRGA